MTNKPLQKVSVITPVCNLVDNELIDKFNLLIMLLDMQTYPNIEHIIIDKNSKDGTVELLSDYKNKGYIQFCTEQDSGKYDAFNKGLMHAQGEYVTFLSCDDFIHDITAISEIIEIMEANNAAYSYGISYLIHPEGYVLLFEPAILNAMQVLPCPHQAMVYRKSALAKIGYFDDKFKIMANLDVIIRLILNGHKGVYYNKNYVTCQMSQKTINFPQRAQSECKAIYVKNFKNLYALTNEILDNMVKYSDFPKPLLEKLSEYYPKEYREAFFKSCEQMKQIRLTNQV